MSPGFSLQKKVLIPEELHKLLPDSHPDCWEKGKKYKMRDELACKLFSKENINKLFSQPDTAEEAVYWLLHYPLTLMLVDIEPYAFQRLVVLCLYTMIRVYDEVKDFKKNGPRGHKLA